MGGGGVFVRLDRVLMSFDRVLMGCFVVAFAVVLGREVVVLGGFFVVLRRLVVCFVCYWFVSWEISRRDPTRPSVNSSLAVAGHSHALQEINRAHQTRPRLRLSV